MMNMPKPPCFCKEYGLHQGDKVYIHRSLDYVSGYADGEAFIEQPVKFCPQCGEELPKGDEQLIKEEEGKEGGSE